MRLANLLLIEGKDHDAENVVHRLSGLGYRVTRAPSLPEDVLSDDGDHPDLVLIAAFGEGEALELTGKLRNSPSSANIPIMILTSAPLDSDAHVRALQSGVDEILAAECSDAELQARVYPLVRLSTIFTELALRSQAAARLGVSIPGFVNGGAAEPANVLVIGDRPQPIRQSLDGSAQLVCVANLYDAETQLTTGNFDAAVLSYAEPAEGVLGFCAHVRKNPRLFNLPLVLASAPGVNAVEAYRSGVSRVLSGAESAETLRADVLALVRRQQLRRTIRQTLQQSLSPASSDPLTGAYNESFIKEYLAGRVKLAQRQRKHLSVVFFAASNMEGVRANFGAEAGDQLNRQMGHWVAALLRAEDLTAATHPGEFCVILPDTPRDEADMVMHRIAGVLSYTDFAVPEVYQPVKLWVQASCTDVHPDDGVESFLLRARHALV